MTTDLVMLVASAVLSIVLALPYLTARTLSDGLGWAAGNRDMPTKDSPWVGRSRRAHKNLTENLAPFAILVLVATVMDISNAATAAGASIFFLARVAHAIIYIAGIPYLRTLSWLVSVVGMLMIFGELCIFILNWSSH